MDSLMERGFHPILVDFEAGAGDIFANAELLADILVHLDGYKSRRPAHRPGWGQHGRDKSPGSHLRLMENEGEPHCAPSST